MQLLASSGSLCGVRSLHYNIPGIFRWLWVKGSIVCNSEMVGGQEEMEKNKKKKNPLSCIWVPARQLSALPFSSCPGRSSSPSVNNWNKSYFIEALTKVQRISEAPSPANTHPTSNGSQVCWICLFTLLNWILNQSRWGPCAVGPRVFFWHFERNSPRSIFTSGDADSWLDTVKSRFHIGIPSAVAAAAGVDVWSVLSSSLIRRAVKTPRNSWAVYTLGSSVEGNDSTRASPQCSCAKASLVFWRNCVEMLLFFVVFRGGGSW